MSRSRYYPGYRYDRLNRAMWYAFKRRRDDLRTGWARVRIPSTARARARRVARDEDNFMRLFFSGRGPAVTRKNVAGAMSPYLPGGDY